MVARHTVTLANSIVGVSVLAMPFCFKQCGIVLATLSLMMGAIITRMVCYFLLKAALMSRRRTYEMLAWSTFGQTGKFMVEISIVGFLIGTLIAFMVVIGDLGPEILSEMFSVENNSSLRTIIMTALSLFVALPLGLLRNIDSLSSVSTASVLFYLFLLLKIFSEGIGPLWSGEYLERIHFWKSGGVLQCIPIFSMALSCQTQIFGIYDALPEPSLQKMNEIVKQAVNICTFFYFCVGFFGYIGFSQQNFGGNILLTFSPAWSTQLIKSMFLMSVVFSVPLVVFPCRASLHSMIFKSVRYPEYKYSLLVCKVCPQYGFYIMPVAVVGSSYHQVHDISTNYIPESRLKFLTVTIVGFTLIIGILIPNIELVLGLVGSTTGSVICIIFPSIMFVRVTSKNTTERLLAQGVFFIGVVLMLLTTYATLYAAEQSQVVEKVPDSLRVTENSALKAPSRHDDVQLNSPISKLEEDKIKSNQVEFSRKIPAKIRPTAKLKPLAEKYPHQSDPQKEKSASVVAESPMSPQKIVPDSNPVENSNSLKLEASRSNQAKKEIDGNNKIQSEPVHKAVKTEAEPEPMDLTNKEVPSKDVPIANKEPISDAKKEFVDKQVAEAFLKKLEEHQENQKKLLAEQKEILEELKQHHAHDVREKIEKDKQTATKEDRKADEMELTNEQPKHETIDDDVDKKKSSAIVKEGASGSNTEDKLMREQQKIIETISANIEKENKNVQLLEKLEEGLNKEVQLLDSEKKKADVSKDKTSAHLNSQIDTAVPQAPLSNDEMDNSKKYLDTPLANSSFHQQSSASVKQNSQRLGSVGPAQSVISNSGIKHQDNVEPKPVLDNGIQQKNEDNNNILEPVKKSPKPIIKDPPLPLERVKENVAVSDTSHVVKGEVSSNKVSSVKNTDTDKVPKEKVDREI